MAKDKMDIQWQGVDDMIERLRQLENKVLWAVKQVALYWGPVMEEYAKKNAKWDDQTGNARASIHWNVDEISSEIVRLYISGGVDYFIYLETAFAGRYSILYPTIQHHLPKIRKMLDDIFK